MRAAEQQESQLLLVGAHGQAGQVDEGLRVVAETLARVAVTGEQAYAEE